MKTGLANIGFGLLIGLVGLGVTAVSYAMVSGHGGSYLIATGAMVVGAWRVLLGLFQIVMGAARGSAPRAVAASPAIPARGMVSAGTSPIVSTAPANSTGLLIVGVILLAQASLRGFFLTTLLTRVSRFGSAIFENVYFVATSVALPALFVVGGLVAGIMLLARAPRAAAVTRAFCVLGLLFQVYVLLQIGYYVYSRSIQPPMMTWFLLALHFAVYLGSMLVVSRSD